LAPFGASQILEIPAFDSGAVGFAAGARAASAAWIVLCEDHCFPPPHWAASLLAAAEKDVVAIAPGMDNPNKATLTSCANFLLCFVDWYRPARAGRIAHGPGHNTCYRAEALREFLPDLERWFNPERVLFLEFERRGWVVHQLADVFISHVNISRPDSYLGQSFHGGRVFGDSRARDWSMLKRLAYASAFLLVPPLRFMRIYRHLGPERRRSSRFWPATVPMLAGLLAHAAGEAVGYLFGCGGSMNMYSNYELRRRDHVRPEEIHFLDAS
jgi:hypothetical protein